jgi:hypothetical protein
MISADMRAYNYFLLTEENGYGQPALTPEVQGTIKMAINITSQSVQDNIKYKDAAYIGLTLEAINDTYVIQYGEELLKVLYINPKGRYKQVFLGAM